MLKKKINKIESHNVSKINFVANKNINQITGTIKKVLDGVASVSHFNAKLGEIVTFLPVQGVGKKKKHKNPVTARLAILNRLA